MCEGTTLYPWVDQCTKVLSRDCVGCFVVYSMWGTCSIPSWMWGCMHVFVIISLLAFFQATVTLCWCSNVGGKCRWKMILESFCSQTSSLGSHSISCLMQIMVLALMAFLQDDGVFAGLQLIACKVNLKYLATITELFMKGWQVMPGMY